AAPRRHGSFDRGPRRCLVARWPPTLTGLIRIELAKLEKRRLSREHAPVFSEELGIAGLVWINLSRHASILSVITSIPRRDDRPAAVTQRPCSRAVPATILLPHAKKSCVSNDQAGRPVRGG